MAAGFAPGTLLLIFSGTYYGIEPGARAGRTYDIAPDGQWFLMVKTDAAAEDSGELTGVTQIPSSSTGSPTSRAHS